MGGSRLVYLLTIFLFLNIVTMDVAFGCSPERRRHPIHIDMNIEIAEPYILQDQSFEQINADSEKSRQEWLEKNGMQEVWSTQTFHTLGYASGGMASNFITSAYALSGGYGAYYCPYYRKIEVNIIYRTLIRIPKEIPKGSCVYNVILEHELRHDKANRESFEKYMSQLRQDLPKMALFYERSAVNPKDVKRRFKHMQVSIKEAVELYIDEFVLPSAAEINEQIDSPESYEADGKKIDACRK